MFKAMLKELLSSEYVLLATIFPGPHAEAHAPHAAAEGLPPADDAAERHAPRHAVGAVHGPAADAADLHLRGHVRDGGRQAGRERQRRALAEVQA